jgi:hypothetical protein
MFDFIGLVLHQPAIDSNQTVSASIKSLRTSQLILAVGIFLISEFAKNR